VEDSIDVVGKGRRTGDEGTAKSGASENPCNSTLATPVTRLDSNHLRGTTASNRLELLM
jgi:hypothetical protein